MFHSRVFDGWRPSSHSFLRGTICIILQAKNFKNSYLIHLPINFIRTKIKHREQRTLLKPLAKRFQYWVTLKKESNMITMVPNHLNRAVLRHVPRGKATIQAPNIVGTRRNSQPMSCLTFFLVAIQPTLPRHVDVKLNTNNNNNGRELEAKSLLSTHR